MITKQERINAIERKINDLETIANSITFDTNVEVLVKQIKDVVNFLKLQIREVKSG